jgi:two-component system NtrC family sensor kinase
MKKFLLSLLFFYLAWFANAQQRTIDSIKNLMPTRNDTLMLVWSSLLSQAYEEVNLDSVPVYNKMYTGLCKKLNLALQEAHALVLSAKSMLESDPANALDLLSTAQNMVEHPANDNLLPSIYLKMLKVPPSITTFRQYRDYVSAIINFGYTMVYWLNNRDKMALNYVEKTMETARVIRANDLMADSYLGLGILAEDDDSSLYYYQKSRQLAQKYGFTDKEADVEGFMAVSYGSKKEFPLEFFYRSASLHKNILLGRLVEIGWSYLGMADYYNRSIIKKDSGLFYTQRALEIAAQTHSPNIEYWSARNLSEFYKTAGNKDSAYKYLELLLQAQQKISSDETSRQFENTDYTHQKQKAAIEAASNEFRNKVKTYLFLAGIGVMMLLAIIFWRNNKRKQREFKLLQQQKAKTDAALQELKSTQAQLIQSEKMASLGELTAGIAHEIQNPLNFVNNFSEVNQELINELVEEADKGNINEVKLIANDIKDNEEKINHHGKRADAIVKGMLQHSRQTSGIKEPTNINALADEYLRLSYHGLKAKDKSFNATLQTDFDESIGRINVVPQDIGRVLLNLFNNAFYAVNERAKLTANGYQPTAKVTTRKLSDKIEVRVEDNGNGIPSSIKEKIFQPFFTTKPTGQGTGLGLSLAYDIVKAHGGEIKVESKEEGGSVFIIRLPIIA